MLEKFILEVDQILVEDRESLLEREKVVLNDCKELAKIILKTEDENLKRIHLVELTLKMTAFLTNGNDVSLIKKLQKSLQS